MVRRVFPLLFLMLSILPWTAPRPTAAFTGVSISAYSVENWIGPTSGVELRLFLSNALTTPEGNTYPASEPKTGVTAWRFACTVTSSTAGGVTVYTVNIPSITIQATTNATVGSNARYYAYFFRSTGVLISEWKGFQGLRIPNSPASTTWQAIRIYNADTVPVADTSTYTKAEIDALLIACCSGSTNYYNTIQEGGANLTQRPTLNAAAGIKAEDNAGSTRTDFRTEGVPTEWINVKTDYGAVGDGVANDTTPVANAIAAASGKILYFPKGTYKITSQLTPISNVIYRGEGPGTVLNITASDAGFGAGTLSNVVIEKLKFTGAVRKMIVVGAGSNVTIRDCEISGATLDPTSGSPAVTTGIYIGQMDDVTIERNRLTSNGYNSASIESAEIYIAASGTATGSRRIKIRNNYIVGTNTKFGIICFDVFDSEVVSNYVDQGNGGTSGNVNGYGITVYATVTTTSIARNRIAGNVVRNCYGSCIYTVASYYTSISDNRIYDAAKQQSDATLPVAGISANAGHFSTITGNTIQTSNRNGIAILGDPAVTTVHGITVTGNTITGAAGEGGINFRNVCRECAVTGNVINGGYRGIYSAASITQTGLSIKGNRIYDPSNAGIYLDTANDSQIEGNRVFSPGGQGVIILAGSRNQIGLNEVKDSASSAYDIRCSSSVIIGNLSDNSSGDFFDSGSNNWWSSNKYISGGAEKIFAGALITSTGTGAQTLDWGSTTVRQFTFGAGNATFTFSNGSTNHTYTLIVIQDGTGSRTITWPSNVKWTAATGPTLTAAAGSKDVFFFVFDGTNFLNVSKMADVR